MEINLKEFQTIGENIKVGIVDNDQLVIVIDTKTDIGASSTGKMMGVASTGGFTQFPGKLKGNIYIGRKNS